MLLDQLKAGTVKQTVIDEKATRIVYAQHAVSCSHQLCLSTPRAHTHALLIGLA